MGLCHVLTVPGNMHVKFEVRSFKRFKLGLIDQSAAHRHTHTDTHAHTSNELLVAP